jgi:TPR repeat protein
MQRLGWLYLHGRGVARHEGVAGTLFRWAAELGDAGAQALAAAHPTTASPRRRACRRRASRRSRR